MTTADYAEQQGVTVRMVQRVAGRLRVSLKTPLAPETLDALDDAFATWHASELTDGITNYAEAIRYVYGKQACDD